MNKKGFTLIELLAVIIILAVIALIATPVVLKVVDEAKAKAAQSSVTGYANAVRLYYVEQSFAGTTISGDLTEEQISAISVEGEKPTCEKVTVTDGKVTLTKCTVSSHDAAYDYADGKATPNSGN